MNHFDYKNGELYCEEVPLARIAEAVGTPTYVYSHATLTRHFTAFDGAFADIPHLTCFSVKSNSNIAVLRLFGSMGGGADIVSGGELYRALAAGIPADRIMFAGVGKGEEEIESALKAGILMFNVESPMELTRLSDIAVRLGQTARVALRVNPDVDPKTHPYISTGMKKNKFGVAIDQAFGEYQRAAGLPGIDVIGVDCHIGSQLTETGPFKEALERLLVLVERLRAEGIGVRYLDLGGGLGITYEDEHPPAPQEYAEAVKGLIKDSGLTLILEPGRVIVGNAGVFLTRVQYTKQGEDKTFVVIDGAMNDLMRPALYDSFHAIQPVRQDSGSRIKADVVGPICESSDFLAKGRMMPASGQGDLLAVMSAGAYGFSMSSNYNSRRRAAEVLVQGGEFFVIRQRETLEDLIRGEKIPAFLDNGV